MSSNQSTNTIDQAKLHEFMMKAVGDIGGSMGAMMIMLGERLGLYKAMAGAGPITSEGLAKKTNTAERYVREWLASQAAAGYITYNTTDNTFSMPPENALVLADENSPFYIRGAYQVIRSILKDEEKFADIFRTGKGLRWGEHSHDLFEGTAKFFKPNYMGNLVQSWIPSLDGVEQKMNRVQKWQILVVAMVSLQLLWQKNTQIPNSMGMITILSQLSLPNNWLKRKELQIELSFALFLLTKILAKITI